MLRIALIVSMVIALASTVSIARNAEATNAFDALVDDLWALEEVYWQDRTWPESNPGPKPALAQVLDRRVVEARADRALQLVDAATTQWNLQIDAHLLQIELDRLASRTRAPHRLQRLFAALDDDAQRIARALALLVYTNRVADQLGNEPLSKAPNREHPLLAEWLDVELPLIGPGAGEFDPAVDNVNCTDDTWSRFTVEPTARQLHTAVWTGTEMIVWGGDDINDVFNTGARYDPATDSWIDMSTTGAPTGRANHTAVWTGTEMLVWGGYTFLATGSNEGARYDPTTDTWTAMSTANVPDERDGHIAVWTGTEMLIWGGYDFDFNLGPGGRYNPSTDSWTAMAFGPEQRPLAAHAWTGTYLVIQGGGTEEASDEFELYNDAWRYNPATNSWLQTGPFPGQSRTQHSSVWTGSELIVWGGYGLVFDSENEEYLPVDLDDGYSYNPLTNGWTTIGSSGAIPSGRFGHTAVWSGSEMIVYGGRNEFGNAFGGGSYRPTTNSWNNVPNNGALGNGLSDHTAVWSGTEMILWGGFGSTGTQSLGSRYLPGPRTWTPTFSSNPPPKRQEHTAVWTGTEMIVHGGVGANQTISYRYDPALNTWSQTAASGLTNRLILHTAVWTGTEMIVWGGLQGSSTTMDDGGRYNPTTDTWSPADQTNGPSARYRHIAGWTGTEMVIWGGDVSDASGGRYNPTTDSWTSTNEVGAPSIRGNEIGIIAGDELIVWGGVSGVALNDGARYDWATDTWTPMTTVGAPAGRYRHSMVWTGSELIVWGGQTESSTVGLDTGGRYDPSTDTWSGMTTIDAPSPRGRHVATWTGNEMVVWGGRSSNSYPREGHRYDPSTNSWTAMSLDQVPSGRQDHTGLWNGSEVMIFGGTTLNRSPLGARYCAASSCTATDWYRDVDGDGFGDVSDVVSACTAPAGYVALAGDCDDANADAWATPSETLDLTLTHDKLSATTTLIWNAPLDPGANIVTYDLLRSTMPDDFTGAGVCYESSDVDLTATDSTTPAAATARFYLPRATNACPQGDGDLGTDSQSTARTGSTCP